jgi:hypothetical protein
MRCRHIIRYILLATWLLPMIAMAAQVQATLDRSTAQLGETVTLNLRVDGADGNLAAPDLGALNKDFDILGTSQNSTLSVVNGAASSAVTFGVALRPRHIGMLTIPAITVGGSSTTPLQLQVTAPDPTAAAAAKRDIFMEAQFEPDHGYVGEQLSYVVRLYFVPDISSGSMDSPQVKGADVSQVGSDLDYTAERGGRQYHVLERRYALIPQHAGHIEVAALNFQGDVVDPNDPDSFFGTSTPVTATAPAQSIEVKSAPADWGNAVWLPARQLTLKLDGWPAANQPVRVGQPITLTMDLQATGLPFAALPAPNLPAIDGATVYPDKPVTGNRNDGQWIIGHRQQAFAVVPERAGTLTLPAITLKWWNVLTDREETAQVPERSVTVLPAIGGSTGQPSTPLAEKPSVAAAPPTAGSVERITPWRWMALGSAGLWLLSLLAWLFWRRYRHARPRVVTATPGAASTHWQQQFIAAAQGSDAAAQEHSLLAWARAERPTIQHLGALAQALGDERQRAAIAALQQRRYGGSSTTDGGLALAQVFSGGFGWRQHHADDNEGDLPPLYPFKLH